MDLPAIVRSQRRGQRRREGLIDITTWSIVRSQRRGQRRREGLIDITTWSMSGARGVDNGGVKS